MRAAATERWQRIVSRRGLAARLLRPLAVLYAASIAIRDRLYRSHVLTTVRLPVPVVVVGNLVVGGAGKTPTTIAIVESLRRAGRRPGIVSRGYGGDASGVLEVERDTPPGRSGDEPLLLRRRTAVPVFVGSDRVAAGRTLLARHPDIDVIVSDDGLQHRRLGRDVQVLVFDERGAGNGWMLPAGPLREPLPARIGRHDLVLYNAPRATTRFPGAVADRRLAGVVELAAWWRGDAPVEGSLTALRGRSIFAVAGIARPQRFFDALRESGVAIEPLPLPDHASFGHLPWPRDAREVVVTEKDAVKLDPARTAPTTVWVAALDFVLPAGFEADLLRLVADLPASHRHGNTPS